jgi:peptidoglycan/LPS O-acetylase OafA/YrhL
MRSSCGSEPTANSELLTLVGTPIALAARRLPGARQAVIAAGVLFVAMVWPSCHTAHGGVDPAPAQDFTTWAFVITHLLFGMLGAIKHPERASPFTSAC